MQRIIAIIIVISFIGMLCRIKWDNIYGRPGPLLGVQQTLVPFPMRKITSFPNLLGFQVTWIQGASLQPPNNKYSSLSFSSEENNVSISRPFWEAPSPATSSYSKSSAPHHLAFSSYTGMVLLIVIIRFPGGIQILPPALFPPLLLCVLPSIPEVLITRAHFTMTKQTHLCSDQFS